MTARLTWVGSCAVLWLTGCAGVISETNHAAALQQAMATDHAATAALLNRANSVMLPYVLEQAILPDRKSFTKRDLSVLAAADLAAWDRILTGLDSYCAALAELTSGRGADALAAASATFGTNVRSLTAATKGSINSRELTAASALESIADILIREKATHDAQGVARQADPAFQTILRDLTDALQGVQRAYEADYLSSTLPQRLKEFPGDAIAGFGALTATERKTKIAEFSHWLAEEQMHDDLILAFGALNASLLKAAAAHRALASGESAHLAEIFADLRAEAQNVSAICQKLTS